MENMQGYLATAVFWPFGKSRSNHPAVLVAARAGVFSPVGSSLYAVSLLPLKGEVARQRIRGGWGPSTYGEAMAKQHFLGFSMALVTFWV